MTLDKRNSRTHLARRAEREMRRWRVKLTASERAEIGEPTRRERVSSEINRERKERARRSVPRRWRRAPSERYHGAHPKRNAGPKGGRQGGGRNLYGRK